MEESREACVCDRWREAGINFFFRRNPARLLFIKTGWGFGSGPRRLRGQTQVSNRSINWSGKPLCNFHCTVMGWLPYGTPFPMRSGKVGCPVRIKPEGSRGAARWSRVRSGATLDPSCNESAIRYVDGPLAAIPRSTSTDRFR